MKKILILIIFIGLGMFTYSLSIPYFTDLKAKEKLENGNGEMNSSTENYQDYKKKYYIEIEKIKTNKILLMDIGAGIIITSFTILLFLYKHKIEKITDLLKLKTMRLSSIYIYGNLIWLLLIPGTIWYYSFRGMREDYSPFADSIGIPIMQTLPLLFLLILPLNLFIYLTTLKSDFPAKLFEIREEYNLRGTLTEMFWGFWILLNSLILIALIADGDHISIPINLFFTYLLLNLRSGQINSLLE